MYSFEHNSPTLSKIIKSIDVPEVISLFFDIGEENDDVYEIYNNLIFRLDSIKNYIADEL